MFNIKTVHVVALVFAGLAVGLPQVGSTFPAADHALFMEGAAIAALLGALIGIVSDSVVAPVQVPVVVPATPAPIAPPTTAVATLPRAIVPSAGPDKGGAA